MDGTILLILNLNPFLYKFFSVVSALTSVQIDELNFEFLKTHRITPSAFVINQSSFQ